MSEGVKSLLHLFDAFPESDKRSAAETLRRSQCGEADMPSSQLDALASNLFSVLDAEEPTCGADR